MALVNNASGSMFDATSLLAYYKFDNLTDSGPNNIGLTDYNGVTFGAGKFGNCSIYSNPSYQVLYSTTWGLMQYAQQNTTSLWFNLPSFSTNGGGFWSSIRNADDHRMSLYYSSYSGTTVDIVFMAVKGIVNFSFAESPYLVAINTWYNLVMTWDYTNASINLYINGKYLTGGTIYKGAGTYARSDQLMFGAITSEDGNTGTFLTGKIDECMMFNRLWSPQEVYNYYQQFSSAMMSGSNY